MSISLHTTNNSFQIGSSSFFMSFFDTIDYHLTKGFFGKGYPIILGEFQQGELKYENLDKAQTELKSIQKRLKKFSPKKIIWDKYDLTKTPPWGNDISSDITDLSNYFVTSEGTDLFETIYNAIENAKKYKSNLIIK